MIANTLKTVSLGFAALAATSIVAAADGVPTGVWLDQSGRGAVEIAPCDDSGTLCGRVVWVKSANHQKRCGEQILGSLKKASDGTWGDGWIYSPDRGRKFDVELKQVGQDKLRVVGFAGIRVFSETHYWKRAAPDLARCGGDQSVAAEKSKLDTVAAAPAPPAPSAEGSAPAASPATGGGGEKSAAAADGGAHDAVRKPAAQRESRGGGSSGLPPQVEKYFKRSADGTCKVDTPWVKVQFDCKRL